MQEKTITKTVYVAKDGKEFLDKDECEKYEKFVKEILSNIRYFCIMCNPDLTETGLYQHKIYVAVLSKRYCLHKEIAIEWALRKFGRYLGESVQGYGFQRQFIVNESSKEEYEKCHPTKWGGSKLARECVFLSPERVEGFPENINYMKEWGFK